MTMRHVMIRYKTSAETAETNAALVRAVFDELRARKPDGLRYTSYRLPDGVTFLHVAMHTTQGENPLTSLASFKAFQKDLPARCVEAPALTELTPVDTYG